MNKFQILLNQIDNIGGVNGYKASTQVSNPWNRAIKLYNNYTKTPKRLSCGDCRRQVYNWLKKNAV